MIKNKSQIKQMSCGIMFDGRFAGSKNLWNSYKKS